MFRYGGEYCTPKTMDQLGVTAALLKPPTVLSTEPRSSISGLTDDDEVLRSQSIRGRYLLDTSGPI